MASQTKSLFSFLDEQIDDRFIFGNTRILHYALIAYLAQGHVLIEGPPGTGKTLLARLLAHLLSKTFKRIQFTSDLLPGDIIGAHIFNPQQQAFTFIKGPLFSDIILADEINRTPPRTQSALLEAMEEKQITSEGETFLLSPDFFVIATQNPREFEGTFPLPEAQLDRFLFKVELAPLSADLEATMLERIVAGELPPKLDSIPPMNIDKEAVRQEINAVRVESSIMKYVADIVHATRTNPIFSWGSSFRGGISLVRCARVLALSQGRDFVTPDDIQELAVPALQHRVRLTPEAQISHKKESDVIAELLSEVRQSA